MLIALLVIAVIALAFSMRRRIAGAFAVLTGRASAVETRSNTAPRGHGLTALGIALLTTIRRHGWATFAWRPARLATLVVLFAMAAAFEKAHPMPGLSGFSHLQNISLAATTQADIASTIAADVSETFKRAYLEAADAIPDATPLTAQLNRTRKFKGNPDGLYFNVKLETGGAVANVGDGFLLPRPTRPKTKQGKSTLCHTYTVVAIGGQSIPLTADTRNAFVANLEQQLEDGMTRVQNDLERQYNGDGRGILCLVLTIVGAPTYGAEKPYGLTGAGPGTMLLIEDMDITHINPGTGLERGRSKINSINLATDEYTTNAAIAGTVIGDYAVLCNDNAATGADAVNNYNLESAGILAVAGSGTFENIAGASYKRWRSPTIAITAKITEKNIGTLDARTRTRFGVKPDLYYTSPGIILGLQEDLAARRMNTGETLDLKGGYEGLKMNNRTVLEGPWCPKTYFFALRTDRKAVGMADVVKMGYVDLDGAKLHRIEGRHAYRADLYFAHQAIWFSRSIAFISGATDDNSIVR